MGHYRQCVKCGERFTAQRVTRRFCSDQCRNQYHRAVWNDGTCGQLSPLLRRVADSIDQGNAARGQLTRLRAMLAAYDRNLLANDTHRLYGAKRRRKKASTA